MPVVCYICAVDAAGNDVFVTMAYTDGCAGGSFPCYMVSPLPDAFEQDTIADLFGQAITQVGSRDCSGRFQSSDHVWVSIDDVRGLTHILLQIEELFANAFLVVRHGHSSGAAGSAI